VNSRHEPTEVYSHYPYLFISIHNIICSSWYTTFHSISNRVLGLNKSQTTISDLVQIPPVEFYKRSLYVVEDKINEKYSNKVLLPFLECAGRLSFANNSKVVQKVGLCVCLYDVLKVSDGLIGHGGGNVNVNGKKEQLLLRRHVIEAPHRQDQI
jgi:hypothetical protein